MKAKIVLHIDRANIPGADTGLRPPNDGRIEEEAIFLQRALRKTGGDVQIIRFGPTPKAGSNEQAIAASIGETLRELL